jgi:diacylglycerol kinase
VLHLDLINTTINATVDAITSTGIGYTTTTTDGVSTTTVSTAASTASSSAY